MAFESLSDKLQNTFKKLRGKGVLTEADINDAMREVKLALLEADVNFKVVKEFVSAVKEKAMGQDVLASLTPGQQVIKIVNDELVEMMGGTNSKLTYSRSRRQDGRCSGLYRPRQQGRGGYRAQGKKRSGTQGV